MTAPPKASPDSLVGVAPVSWGLDNADLLSETHARNWLEEAIYSVEALDDDAEITAKGTITFEDGTVATLMVEEPLEELHTLAGTSKEPYTPTEVVMLKDHSATWRFVLEAGTERGVQAAHYFGRIASTLVEAGAGGIFMPGLVTLHSPRFIKLVTMDPSKPQNVTNLCIHAWHADDWMMTRGLTAFGLPELETPIDEGMNAAYFRLLDVAAGMLSQQRPFPDGANLDVGPKSYRITSGRSGPEDEQVPFSGTFGVHTIALA